MARFCAPIEQLIDEHISLRTEMDLFYEIIEEIEFETESTTVIHLFAKLHNQILHFNDHLKAHSKREDEGLFPMMARHIGENDRTIEIMEFEHEKAEGHLQDFLNGANQARRKSGRK